jgi:hypothetical protein
MGSLLFLCARRGSSFRRAESSRDRVSRSECLISHSCSTRAKIQATVYPSLSCIPGQPG